MTYEKITLERVGGVCVIRLNDPSSLNAIGLQMMRELDHAFDEAPRSSRAMLLSSLGRAFCSGANLKEDLDVIGEDGQPDMGRVLERHINPLMDKLRRLPIPWVSAVRGAAGGVGCSLALAADMIVASEDAYFLQAFARIGLVPDGGAAWLLTRAAGRPRAMEMMLLGERLPAAQALEWGLINRLASSADLDAAALSLAETLASGPTRALGMIREMAWAAADSRWSEVLSMERAKQREAGLTQDHKEGAAAFLAKRPARFTGQ